MGRPKNDGALARPEVQKKCNDYGVMVTVTGCDVTVPLAPGAEAVALTVTVGAGDRVPIANA